MSPKPSQPVTLKNWERDVKNVPAEVLERTIAAVRAKNSNYLGLSTMSRAPFTGLNADQFMMAQIEGDEAFRDVKGVNISLDLQKLAKDPVKTIKVLGIKTVQDIFSVNELSAHKRSLQMTDLLNGKALEQSVSSGLTPDQLEDKFRTPDSPIIRNLDKSFPLADVPIDFSTGKSLIQLLVPNKTAGTKNTIPYEDRMTVEEKEWEKRATQTGDKKADNFKTYSDLAKAAIKLSGGSMERHEPRLLTRDEVLLEYHRCILREMGVDLNQTLSNGPKDLVGKTFYTTLTSPQFNGDVEALIADDKMLMVALGLDKIPDGAAVFAQNKLLLQQFARAEELSIKSAFVPPVRASGTRVMSAHRDAKLSTKIGSKEYSSNPILPTDNILDVSGKKAKEHIESSVYISDLTYEKARALVELDMLSDGSEARIRAAIAKGIEAKYQPNTPAWRNAYNQAYQQQLATFGNQQLNRAMLTQAKQAAEDFVKDEKDKAIKRSFDRLESAKKVKDIGNGLFFAGLTNDFLTAVAGDSVIEQMLVTSRLLASIPWASSKFKSGADLANFFDISTILGNDNPVAKIAGFIIDGRVLDANGQIDLNRMNPNFGLDKIPQYLGLTASFEGDLPALSLAKIPYISKIFKKRVSLHWPPSVADPAAWKPAKFVTVNATDATGLFGKGPSIFKVLSTMEGHEFFNIHNAADLLANQANLTSFLDDLEKASRALISGNNSIPGLADEFFMLAGSLGLDKQDVLNEFLNHRKNFFNNGGYKMLENLERTIGVLPHERWAFLQTLSSKGLVNEFTKKYAGILDIINRRSNEARAFFFNNILNNPQLANKFFFVKWGQKLAKNVGISDEIKLLEAVKKWAIFVAIRDLSIAINTLSAPAYVLTGYIGAGNALQIYNAYMRLETTRPGRLLLRLLETEAGKRLAQKGLLRFLAYALNAAAGAMSGGVSWVITILGGAIWKVTKGLILAIIKLDPDQLKYGLKEAKEELFQIVKVALKLLVFPTVSAIKSIGKLIAMSCSCMFMGCTALLFVVIMILGSFVAPLDGMNSKKVQDTYNSVSKIIQVEKGAEWKDGKGAGTIEYTIKITNTSSNAVTIEAYEDNLFVSYKKEDECMGPYAYGESGFVGQYQNDDYLKVPGTLIDPGQTYTVKYTLDLTKEDEGFQATYTNTVRVKAANDNNFAIDSASVDINGGGCQICPQGWPTSGTVTQGPGGQHNTWRGKGGEAVDIATSSGSSVYATMPGTAYKGKLSDAGNYIKIVNGNVSIAYEHLQKALIVDGQKVKTGELIGLSGNTGYSTGTHLHYDFMNTPPPGGIQCAGNDLRLVNPFVPSAVKRDCSGYSECNQSVSSSY